MKNHKNLIRLIIATAALVALGVFAFKFMRTYSNISQGYQAQIAQEDQVLQQDGPSKNDTVVIQSGTAKQNGYCVGSGSKCSSSTPCCRPFACGNGYCVQ